MNDIKLVQSFECLPPEFDQRKAYILANQNLCFNEAAKLLASNEVQILEENSVGAKIKSIAMATKLKKIRVKIFTTTNAQQQPILQHLWRWNAGNFKKNITSGVIAYGLGRYGNKIQRQNKITLTGDGEET